MTRLEVIKFNKNAYSKQLERNKEMTGLARLVGEVIVLRWIKGRNWMGGLSDREYQKYHDKIAALGYSDDEIIEEYERQILGIQ